MEKTCDDRKQLIFDYVEGFLTEEEKSELEAHIGACPVCRNTLREAQAVSRLLADYEEEPPAELFAGVMAGVKKEKAARLRRRLLKFVPAAACLILVVGVLLLIPFLGSRMAGEKAGNELEGIPFNVPLDKTSSSDQENASDLTPSCGESSDLSDEDSEKEMPNEPETAPLDWLSLFFDPSGIVKVTQASPDAVAPTEPALSEETEKDGKIMRSIRLTDLWGYTVCAFEDAPKSGAVAVMKKDGVTLWLLPRAKSGAYRDVTVLSESGEYLAVLATAD